MFVALHKSRERERIEQLITNDEMRTSARDLVDRADVRDSIIRNGARERAIDSDKPRNRGTPQLCKLSDQRAIAASDVHNRAHAVCFTAQKLADEVAQREGEN